MTDVRFLLATPRTPGAIAIVELFGDVEALLPAITGRHSWPLGRTPLVTIGDVDEGLAVLLTPHRAQLMPHGGIRVLERVAQLLVDHGAVAAELASIEPAALYPEARDRFEALALAAIARAASPIAIDLLLDQPRRWRASPVLDADDEARSARLNRLIDPPAVVVAGPPNVGKSTLTNALLGREAAIALDLPGTTRDYTSWTIDLGGVVVRWLDTPGLSEPDTSEPSAGTDARAIELASRAIADADLLIAMTDAAHAWPRLPRAACITVASKADLVARGDAALAISSATRAGLDALVTAVRERLVPRADMAHPGPWRFDRRL